MSKPNFFIVGAPKCGTTALCEYLRKHPNIFISLTKEPHYFATDFPGYRTVTNEKDYLALFDEANRNQSAIGEGSVFYMYSRKAIQNIWNYNNKAKLIIMLRNPCDLVYSMHSQLLYTRDEDVKEFSEAWNLNKQRKLGLNVSKQCRDRQILYYDKIAKMGEQVERLLDVFPREQIKIVYFDDFIRNTHIYYKEVLEFLGLPDDNRKEFPKVNENKRHKWDKLADFTERPPKTLVHFAQSFKKIPGVRSGLLSAMEIVRKTNENKGPRHALSQEFREKLIAEYRGDILKLSQITNKDLSHWIEAESKIERCK